MIYPNVCIVTPTLNQAGFIKETIDSVLSQDYPYIEYIVIDGGSTDGTQDILRSYGNKLVWREYSGNQAMAINYGMKLGNGLIRHWLNSDDMLLTNAVTRAVETFKAAPYAGVVFGNTIFTGPTGIPLYQSFVRERPEYLLHELARNPIPQPSAFIAQKAWQDLDTSLEYFMDWDLWLRVQQPLVYVDEPWSTYRIHDNSKTGKADYPVNELYTIYAKRGYTVPPVVYERMAEYHEANGEWAKAKFRRFQGWMRG